MPRRGRAEGARETQPAGAGLRSHGLPLREMLELSTLSTATVLAGESGLGRIVRRLNVMTVPDIVPWVKEDEFLLATGYPLPRDDTDLRRLVTDLDARGVAALGIKLAPYVAVVSPAVLAHADELGFPVIEVPESSPFDDILSQTLTVIASRQAAELARSEEIHRAFVRIVLEGGGLAEITDRLAQLVGAPVGAVDDDGRVLAGARLHEVDDTVVTDSALGERGRLLLTENLTSEQAHFSEVAGRTCAAVRVVAGSMRHGLLFSVEGRQPFPDDVLIALERAATVAALDAAKKLAVTAVERRYRLDFLHELLQGRVTSVGDVLKRAAVFGWNLERPLAVVVAEFAGARPDEIQAPGKDIPSDLIAGDENDHLVNKWVFAVGSHDPGAAASGFISEFVAVVGAEHGHDPVDVADAVSAEFAWGTRRAFCLGVSRTVESPLELHRAYDEAIKAVQIGRRVNGAGSVTSFDSLGVFRLLSLVEDPEELRAFAREVLGPVLALDRRERTAMLETLGALMQCNLNLAEAARTLHFHYNTMRYRAAKLEGLLGPFTGDVPTLLRVGVALEIVRMRSLFGADFADGPP